MELLSRNALKKRSPGIIRKSRVSYPGHGFLSSATWPSLPKKHYNGLNFTTELGLLVMNICCCRSPSTKHTQIRHCVVRCSSLGRWVVRQPYSSNLLNVDTSSTSVILWSILPDLSLYWMRSKNILLCSCYSKIDIDLIVNLYYV